MKRPTAIITTNGKQREIVLYSEEELKAQRELNAALQMIFDDNTHASVCSYRKGQSTIKTVQEVASYVGLYKNVLKLDIMDYFPSISRKQLAAQLNDLFHYKTKGAIMDYVCASKRGIAQGSPLSPALSNIYLNCFDETISSYHDVFYRRYCDDILILTNLEPTQILRIVEAALLDLGLRLKHSKTQIGSTEQGFDFIGFHINTSGYWITPSKISDVVRRIRHTSGRRRKREIIRGWWAYCSEMNYLPGIPDSVLLLILSGRILSAIQLAGEIVRPACNILHKSGAIENGSAKHTRALSRRTYTLKGLSNSTGLVWGLVMWVLAAIARLVV